MDGRPCVTDVEPGLENRQISSFGESEFASVDCHGVYHNTFHVSRKKLLPLFFFINISVFILFYKESIGIIQKQREYILKGSFVL